jgi:hypothetical protein
METEDSSASVSETIQEVKRILWGQHIDKDLFQRWSQGKKNN